MNFILFDDERLEHFLPLTHTRPLAALRCGILTMQEKWQHTTTVPVYYLSRTHLQEKFELQTGPDNLLINSACFTSADFFEEILKLQINESLVFKGMLLAIRLKPEDIQDFQISERLASSHQIPYSGSLRMLENLWDIFSKNDEAIRDDFKRLSSGRTSAPIPEGNQVIGDQLFIEPGARIFASIINTTTGPVYIGKNAEVMEGSLIRGPFALGEDGVLKMGAKIYGATTIGPGCKVGGEVNNSVFYGNSNKAHDGFIGNAVIGEWCNIGADSNNSNLKNNYEEVKLWSEQKKSFIKTGLQFCGLIMGDHSKCGINTMFNTGTVVGVSCNVYGAGFPRNFIPSFSWGSANGFMEYQLIKAIDTASRVYARRKLFFDATEKKLMEHVFLQTKEQRNY